MATKPIENLTVLEQATFREEIGANNASNITSGTLALAYGGPIFKSDLTIKTTEQNSGIYYRAVESGPSANTITVQHVVSGTGTSATVTVSGRAISVTCNTSCTQATAIAAVNASSLANVLVTASGLGTTTSIVLAKAATQLNSSVIQGADGSITLGVPTGDKETSIGAPDPGPGNFFLQDKHYLGWKNANGSVGPNIYWWQSHDAVAGEWLFTSPWRTAWIQTGPLQFGGNASVRDAMYFHMVSGAATNTDRIRSSKAISFQTLTYDGTTSRAGYVAMQGTSASEAGNSAFLKVNIVPNGTAPVVGDDGAFNTTNGNINGTTALTVALTKTTAPAFEATTGGFKLNAGVITFADNSTLGNTTQISNLVSSSARANRVALVGGNATVAETSVTAYTDIFLQRKAPSGTLGHLSYTKTTGVGFAITSSSNTDTSTVSYMLVESAVSDISPPTISGTNEVTDTLTASGGSGTYQWFSGASAISGATSATYVIDLADIGAVITCQRGGVASNAITVWKPSDEGSLYADYRGDVGLLQTVGGSAANTNGQAVQEWVNQVSGNPNLTQTTTGAIPTLDTSSMNGVLFDGNDLLQSVGGLSLTVPQTAFIVATKITHTGANKRLFSTGEAGTRMLVEPLDDGEIRNNPSATTTGTKFPLSSRRIVTSRTTATQNFISVDDGGAYNGTSTFPTEFSATETTGAGGRLCVGGTSTANGVNAKIFAVLYYQATLSNAAQFRVRKYLKAKWGTI